VSLGHWGADNLLRVYGDGTVYMGTVTTGVWQGSSISTTYTDAKVTSVSAGTGISINTTTGAVTVTNSGVTSIAGTSNQITASASTGGVTLSLPQNIHTSASPTFNRITNSGLYGPGGTGNIPIWQYDASNTGFGIVYNESSPDTLRIDVSGQALSGTPDVLIGPDYMQVNGNTVYHAGNIPTWNQNTTGTASNITAFTINQNVGTGNSPTFTGLALGDGIYTYSDTNRDAGAANYNPNAWARGFRFSFANASSTSTAGNYSGVLHLHPWDGTTSSTGDASYQLAFGSTASNGGGMPQLRLRKGIDTTWNSWYTVPIKVTASFSSVSSVTVTHNLNTKDVMVMCYDNSDEMFWPSNIVTTSVNVVTITFAASRTGRVVVIG
jgi:hypothetical protein